LLVKRIKKTTVKIIKVWLKTSISIKGKFKYELFVRKILKMIVESKLKDKKISGDNDFNSKFSIKIYFGLLFLFISFKISPSKV
jgi:hypothetical protein